MIGKIFGVATCTACFFYTFYVLCKFTHFLSHTNDDPKQYRQDVATAVGEDNVEPPVFWLMLVDMSLLSTFMLQHTIMAKDSVENTFKKLHIGYLSRSVYNAASAAVLHLLLSNWQIIPSVTAWKTAVSSNLSMWYFFTGLHVLAWIIIYSGCLMMDIAELLGLKQVYYKVTGRPDPTLMKSQELLRYYKHMRHPSFTGFLIILWIHPFMTIDRLLLAFVLTIYMALKWNIDKADYNYHTSVIKLKQTKLL